MELHNSDPRSNRCEEIAMIASPGKSRFDSRSPSSSSREACGVSAQPAETACRISSLVSNRQDSEHVRKNASVQVVKYTLQPILSAYLLGQ